MKKKIKKRKLIVSSTLLFVCLASLTAASYAWFTANQTVSLSQLDINVAASSGIDISADAATWKTTLTNNDLTALTYTGNRNQLPTTLKPVSSPKTVTSGYLNIWDGTIENSVDNFYIVANKLTDPSPTGSGTLAASNTGDYIVFDVFIKSSATHELKLLPTSSVSYITNDYGLKNAARIAIINEGVAPVSSPGTARSLVSGTTAQTWLWEPNANIHTANGVLKANDIYALRYSGVGTSTVLTGYDAVKANILLTDTVLEGATANTESNFLAYLSQGVGGIDLQTNENAVGTPWTAVGAANDNIITTISEGINKLKVYAWIEGQDVDCENGASGTGISFNLGFTIE